MLPTFVIGLREGLEASLIVGIIATFLAQQGRRDVMRWVWLGVGTAIALRMAEQNLPQRQQEGLETVVGLAAVAMVTWMIVWMSRNARGLKRDLEGKAAVALAGGSVGTLVVMAFFAVLREGLETAVFLLAAFQGSRDPGSAGTGATLGVVVAVVVGIAIYRGGLKLNMEKFFRFTGFVLVLVAAGLVATAAHTAHEAGWLNVGQHQVFDLSWFVGPGSIRSALLTGMLGIQVRPVTVEVLAYLVYLVPMALFVLKPARPRRAGGTGGSTSRARAVDRSPAAARSAVGASALVAVVALSACGSSSSSKTGAGSTVKRVSIELVKAGCIPAKLTLPSGPTTFDVDNTDADAIDEQWDRDVLGDQENVIGRVKSTGAPLGGHHERDTVRLSAKHADGTPVIPADAHIRLAAPATNGGAHLLRRGYSFTDGVDPVTAGLEAGLFFLAYMRDPRRQFVPIQHRLAANDALNEYIEHTSSAIFAVPPGVEHGGYIGGTLFA